MITLHIMVGIPGSGKSFYIQQKNVDYVSRDEVRYSILTDEDEYFDKEKEVYKEFVNQIVDKVYDGVEDLYIDATHLNENSRGKLLKSILRKMPEQVNIVFEVFLTNIETCLKRNARRTGRAQVPATTILSMYRDLVVPSMGECAFYQKNYKVKKCEVIIHDKNNESVN